MAKIEDLELLQKITEEMEKQAQTLPKVKEAYAAAGAEIANMSSLQKALKQDIADTEGLSSKEIQNQQNFVAQMKQRLELAVSLGELSDKEAKEKLSGLDTLDKQLKILKEREKTGQNELDTVLKKNESLINIKQRFKDVSDIGNLRLSQEELINNRMQFGHMIVASMLETLTKYSGILLDLAVEVDTAARTLMRGASFSYEEARRGLVDITATAAGSGVSIKEAASVMTTLKDQFSAFTTLTAEGRKETGAMVAVLDKMGIAAKTSAQFLDVGTKSLGMSRENALEYLSSLKSFADQSGVSMDRLSADLAANASNLTKFGDTGTKVFKEMELASKQLGIAMSDLFQMTEKFTTFSGAAQAAGQLNAVLGGDFLNSVDLLTASMEDPTAVFKQFKEAMDSSGKSFDDIDNGMKRVIASSMGMTVEQAGRVLAMDINTATAAMKEQAATQKTLNEMSNRMVAMGERLQTAFAALYPAIDPIITILAEFVDLFAEFAMGLAEFVQENPIVISGFKVLATVIGALGFAIGVLGTTILPIYAQIKTMQLLFGGVVPAIRFLISGLGGFGTAIVNAISSIISFSIAMIGNFITSIARGISAVVSFSVRMIVSFIPSLISGISAIVRFAAQMVGSFISSMISATVAVVRFGIQFAASILASFASGAKAAGKFALSLITKLVPAFGSIVASGFTAGFASTAAGEGAAIGGTLAEIGAVGFLALGAAALMMGAGIGLAAWGVSTIVSAFADLISQTDGSVGSLIMIGLAMITTAYSITVLTGAIGVMVLTLAALALSGAGPAAVTLMYAIGAAALMMGAAIAVAAFGVSLLVKSIGEMFVSATGLVESLSKIDATTIANYMQLTTVFVDLAKAINEIDTDVLESLGDLGTKQAIGAVTKQVSSVVSYLTGPSTEMDNPANEARVAGVSAREGQPIKTTLNVTIDSPVYLKDKEIGRIMSKKSEEVFQNEMKRARTADV